MATTQSSGAQQCFADGIAHAFQFLSLPDMSRAARSCHDWLRVVARVPPQNIARNVWNLKRLPSGYSQSPFLRHMGHIANCAERSISEMRDIFRSHSHLRTFQGTLNLPSLASQPRQRYRRNVRNLRKQLVDVFSHAPSPLHCLDLLLCVNDGQYMNSLSMNVSSVLTKEHVQQVFNALGEVAQAGMLQELRCVSIYVDHDLHEYVSLAPLFHIASLRALDISRNICLTENQCHELARLRPSCLSLSESTLDWKWHMLQGMAPSFLASLCVWWFPHAQLARQDWEWLREHLSPFVHTISVNMLSIVTLNESSSNGVVMSFPTVHTLHVIHDHRRLVLPSVLNCLQKLGQFFPNVETLHVDADLSCKENKILRRAWMPCGNSPDFSSVNTTSTTSAVSSDSSSCASTFLRALKNLHFFSPKLRRAEFFHMCSLC